MFFDILEAINKVIKKGEKAFKNVYLQMRTDSRHTSNKTRIETK